MLLVISEEREQPTNFILEYIEWNGGAFIRINEENLIEDLTISINSTEELIDFEFKDQDISLEGIKYIWYRRGDFSIKQLSSAIHINNDIHKFLKGEWLFIKKTLHTSQLSLSNFYQEVENNRINNMRYARKSGFKIPETLITTSKKRAVDFLCQYKNVITKPIHNCHLDFSLNQNKYSSTGTRIVTPKDFEALGSHFAPMLLQTYIEKEVELRIFFLENQLFPMAIFSQFDAQTTIDYRNYNEESPNRNVPFKFDAEMTQKVMNFIKMSQLNTGSIDLILTPSGEYFFLEVNPTGQYGWVSHNCNYYIENHIAQYLLTKIKP